MASHIKIISACLVLKLIDQRDAIKKKKKDLKTFLVKDNPDTCDKSCITKLEFSHSHHIYSINISRHIILKT